MNVCEFCGNHKFIFLGKAVFINKLCDVIQCEICKNVVKDCKIEDDELLKFYQNIEHDNYKIYKNKLERQKFFLKKNINFKNIDSVLEIGPGNKGLFSMLPDNVKKTSCEIDKSAIEKLKKRGIENFTSLDYINKKFDLIIASHVIEHITEDISIYIKKLYELLNNGGVIFIEVPTASSELMIYKNKLINHDFSRGHKRSSYKVSYEKFFENINISKFIIYEDNTLLRNIEYNSRFKYSKILSYLCENRNSRIYFFKNFFSFAYNFFISLISIILIKILKIPPNNLKILIYK